MLRVVADVRERGSGVLAALKEPGDVCVSVRRLDVGDYVVDGRVIVERKTLDDLVVSILDARLFRQSSRMLRSPYRPLFIIEGRARDLRRRLARRKVQGALVTVSLIFDIAVLRTRDPVETAWLLHRIGEQLRVRTARGVAARRPTPRDRRARQLHLLDTIPGVGVGRAERLLDAFGTLTAVLNASESDLAAVRGIGPQTARQIRTFLDEPPPTNHPGTRPPSRS